MLRHCTKRFVQFQYIGDCIAQLAHILDGTFGGGFVTVSASIFDDDRNKAQVSPMAHVGWR